MESMTFEEGHDIIKQGDPGETLFIIIEGRAMAARYFPAQKMENQALSSLDDLLRFHASTCISSLFPFAESSPVLPARITAPAAIVKIHVDASANFLCYLHRRQPVSLDETSFRPTYYGVGDYFGEVALLSDKPRAASVRATSRITLSTLDKQTFLRLLGPCEEVLTRRLGEIQRLNNTGRLLEGGVTLDGDGSPVSMAQHRLDRTRGSAD